MSEDQHIRQYEKRGPHHAFAIALCLVLILTLGACGKRAGHIDPPSNVEDDKYPLVYPDPSTDPKP